VAADDDDAGSEEENSRKKKKQKVFTQYFETAPSERSISRIYQLKKNSHRLELSND